jgi:hypothetical protein
MRWAGHNSWWANARPMRKLICRTCELAIVLAKLTSLRIGWIVPLPLVQWTKNLILEFGRLRRFLSSCVAGEALPNIRFRANEQNLGCTAFDQLPLRRDNRTIGTYGTCQQHEI